MTSKLLFIGRFLTLFAVFIVLGWLTDAPTRYATALRYTAAGASPLVNGWWLESRRTLGGQTQLWFRQGDEELQLLLNLETLALGVLPLLSLLGATPGFGIRQLVVRALIGCTALFGLDLLVVLAYPFLVVNPNAWTDILGTFLGLLTFVGGPVILWFLLTYKHLRAVWHSS